MHEHQTSSHLPWLRSELCRRVRFMWLTKTVATSSGIAAFFWLYFAVMRSPLGLPLEVSRVRLDNWIPVSDLMMVPYGSLWFYISVSVALMGSAKEVKAFMVTAAAMALVGLAIFWMWPTYTPAADFSTQDYPLLSFLRDADQAGNALPSLHVSFAVLAGLLIDQQLRLIHAPQRWRAINFIWCLAIIYSTIATGQHVMLDVVGGLAFVTFFWNLYLFQIPQWHLINQRVRRTSR